MDSEVHCLASLSAVVKRAPMAASYYEGLLGRPSRNICCGTSGHLRRMPSFSPILAGCAQSRSETNPSRFLHPGDQSNKNYRKLHPRPPSIECVCCAQYLH